ncbi:MAG: ABC transporter ATP-binding protein [Thermodesulfovibrionia bacterium]|nr:ABC transporter ATP-binding protein [Thermodesulfovibrionia bacterium]
MSLRLNVLNISKSFNGKAILKECSVSFDSGGVHVLMGPNGSGKSTFLRICALLERPDKGEVRYVSESATLEKDISLKRRITLVLPGVGVFNTTVFENVAYGLQMRGVKKKEIEEKTLRVLEFVGLTHKRDHNALVLSSGEIQRLGIARALVIEPEILFLDEPTAYIDQENTEIIEDIILNMKKQGRSTVIITTHYMERGARLADRVLIIQDGQIIDKKSV